MVTHPEKQTPSLIPREELTRRRTEARKLRRARQASASVLLALGITSPVIVASVLSRKANPEKAKLRAALIQKEIPTSNPNIVIEPYDVGTQPQDVLLSEVAADLHPMVDGQDAMDEILALKTYLKPNQMPLETFTPGQHLDIGINTAKGQIVAETDLPDSAHSAP